MKYAEEGIPKLIVPGRSAVEDRVVLFSTEEGDAWLLHPEEDLALCLRWRNVTQEPLKIRSYDGGIQIGWDGSFDLSGEMFVLDTTHPDVGTRGILGYPLEELREVFRKLGSVSV